MYRQKILFLTLFSTLVLGLSSCASIKNDNKTAAKEPQQSEDSTPKKEFYSVSIHSQHADIDKLLYKYLSLVNKRFMDNLDEDQIDFLKSETPEEVNQMLGTIGYFNNTVDIKQKENHFDVNVKLGKKVVIDNIIIVFEGPIEQDEDLALYYREALLNWRLELGYTFNQTEWAKSRDSVLTVAKNKKYALAKIQESKAELNPATGKGELSVYIDSGNPIKFSTIEVSGTERYPENVVTGLANFQDSSYYSIKDLLDYQQALESEGHYSNVVVYADFNELKDDMVPVKVDVKEVPKQKVDLGLSYNTEEEAGIRLGYTHYNMFKRGYTGSSLISWNKFERKLGLGFSQPRNREGYYYSTTLNLKDSSLQNLNKQTLHTGVWLVRSKSELEARLGVEHYREKAEINNGPSLGNAYASMITFSGRRNKIESNLRPSNGYFVYGRLGTTLGKLASSSSIQTIRLDSAYYFTPEKRRLGTLALRGSLAYVYAKNKGKIPSDLLFRTGGANSVRGYGQDSIGLDGPNNSILGGKSLAVFSTEYQIPIKNDYAFTIFHDVGDVKNNFKDFKFKHASGIGFQWYSPVAPISLDIAYAHTPKKIGWHINLGTKF